MRDVTLKDVEETFTHFESEDAASLVDPASMLEIIQLIAHPEELEAKLSEFDEIRFGVQVYGAFTAGLLTAKRLMEEAQD